MSIFDLFKKTPWSKLIKYDSSIQSDIALIIALDALVKSSVRNSLKRFCESIAASMPPKERVFIEKLNSNFLAAELELAVLSTGRGSVFPDLRWSKLNPDFPIKFLGILAMCQYRNSEKITIDNEIANSGYSSLSSHARTQYLVLLAKETSITDFSIISSFAINHFNNFWFDLRNLIFRQIQKSVAAEPSGLTKPAQVRFESLSKSRQEIILMLADSLEKSNADVKPKEAPAQIPVGEPAPKKVFDKERHMIEHPFLYIPHHELSKIILEKTKSFANIFVRSGIDEYEFRRASGLKDDVPSAMITIIMFFDFSVLSYCSAMALIQSKEPKFTGSGVWKAVTQKFEKDNIGQFAVMASFRNAGFFNANVLVPGGGQIDHSPAIDLMTIIRKSAGEYVKSNDSNVVRLKLLTQGTVALSNLLGHPKYSEKLVASIESLILEIDNEVVNLSNGKLIPWDQQKKQ